MNWKSSIGWITSTVVVSDWATKFLILERLAPSDRVAVIPAWFTLVHQQNRGIAFGMLNQPKGMWQAPLLIVLAAVAVFVILRMAREAKDAITRTALALVAGGAVGNLGDRALNGAVTDFIAVRYFPWIFNVADMAITTGAILLAITLLRKPRPQADAER